MLSIGAFLRRMQLRASVLQLHSSYSSSAAAIQAERTIKEGPRNDWTRDEIKAVYDSPLLDLLFHGVSIITTITISLLAFSFHLEQFYSTL